jgi:predicted nuclease with TOPRIM domain
MAKRDLTAYEAAKNKVSNLLVDVLPKKEEKKENILEEAIKESGNEWMEEQISALTEENEQLKEDYQKIFNELQKVKSNPVANVAGVPNSQLEHELKMFFDILVQRDQRMQGNAVVKLNYVGAGAPGLLQEMLQRFPFLK